jgi:RNA polymerase sigma factor (sigma-70 family)
MMIKLCLKGDRAAQKELYEMYKVNMFALCQRYFSDIEDAKDTLQEGFIKIYRDLNQYSEDKGTLGSWIKKVFINTCLEKLRKNKLDFQSLDTATETIGFESTIVSDLNLRDLTLLIQNLPLGYRTVFNLYVIEGYSHKEIGEQLNISENTSKTQLMKAKNMLKNKLEEILNEQ